MEQYPVYSLKLSDVKLTDHPLDDYQRLYFSTLAADPAVATVEDNIIDLNIRRVQYKSNIAPSFRCV